MRLSVTKVEAFRRYRVMVSEGRGDWDEFIEELQEPWRDSALAKAGRDFHARLEQAERGDYTGNEKVTTRFDWDNANVTLLRPEQYEVSSRLPIPHPDGSTVTLSGRIDAITGGGKIGIERKTTYRAINLDKYLDSFQWRAYALMWPTFQKVRYEIFQFRQDRKTGVYRFQKFRELDVQPYRGLYQDVGNLVCEFVDALREWESQGKLVLGPKGVVPRER